jgi:hypothetical protein
MDDVRAMLDELMGRDRNLSLEEKKKYKPPTKKFSDPVRREKPWRS